MQGHLDLSKGIGAVVLLDDTLCFVLSSSVCIDQAFVDRLALPKRSGLP